MYLTRAEVAAASQILGLSLEDFMTQYCARVGGYLVFRFDEPECPMLGEEGCRIYAARPVQCRTWPFWPQNLSSRRMWERKVVAFCPGALHKGAAVDYESICEQSVAMRRSQSE